MTNLIDLPPASLTITDMDLTNPDTFDRRINRLLSDIAVAVEDQSERGFYAIHVGTGKECHVHHNISGGGNTKLILEAMTEKVVALGYDVRKLDYSTYSISW